MEIELRPEEVGELMKMKSGEKFDGEIVTGALNRLLKAAAENGQILKKVRDE